MAGRTNPSRVDAAVRTTALAITRELEMAESVVRPCWRHAANHDRGRAPPLATRPISGMAGRTDPSRVDAALRITALAIT
ncbi:hypothetical protein [Amycolatopsis thermoflava]|uniref:hypothetical protein n=1 Tax=Amycolatopsis thermoflava TaxID=84480 RepID=UPI003813CC6C